MYPLISCIRVYNAVGFLAAAIATCGLPPIEVAADEVAWYAPLKGHAWDRAQVVAIAGTNGFKVFAGNPVLSPGKQGEWDSGAIGSMTIVDVDGLIHLYYEAWGRTAQNPKSVDYSTLQIGHAVSFDGVHWMKDPANPVIPKGSVGKWDAAGTWDPFVLFQDGVFKLWYGGGIDATCDWGYSESRDGRHFEKRGRISKLGHVEDDHVVRDPESGDYWMYYWDRQHEPRGLFRVESKDETGFDFSRAIPIGISGDNEHEMNKFTHVLFDRGRWYMFYADFVRPGCAESRTRLAVSNDGIHWKCVNRNLFGGHDADILPAGNSLYIAYFGPSGRFDQMDSDVRLAVFRGDLAQLADRKD